MMTSLDTVCHTTHNREQSDRDFVAQSMQLARERRTVGDIEAMRSSVRNARQINRSLVRWRKLKREAKRRGVPTIDNVRAFAIHWIRGSLERRPDLPVDAYNNYGASGPEYSMAFPWPYRFNGAFSRPGKVEVCLADTCATFRVADLIAEAKSGATQVSFLDLVEVAS